MKDTLTFSLTIIFLFLSSAAELPSFIKKCSKKDPVKLNECLLERIEELKPRLAQGIPELKLPPIEPLRIPKLEVQTGSGSTVSFDSVLTDLQVYGVKDFTTKSIDFNFETKSINIHIHVPKLEIRGTYAIAGKILLFEIHAKGLMEANVTNTDAVTHMDFSIVTKNGKEYIEPGKKYDLENHKYEKISLYFHDIIKNNEMISQQVNKAINDNIESLAKEVNPIAFEAIHLVITGIVNPVFQDYSMDELFDN